MQMPNNSIMENWKDEYLQGDDTYKNHVVKFIDYIIIAGKQNRPASITKEDAIDSIGHYNKLGKINTVSSMENHLEAVKAFYKHLVGKEYTQDIFNNISSFQEFKDSIIEKFGLKETIEREFLPNEVIKEILDGLDSYFKNTDLTTIRGINERKFYDSNILLRIFFKLTLIAPAKKSVVCSVKKSDFSEDYRTLIINNVKVSIPNGLHRDIIHAVELIEKLEKRKFGEGEKLFDYVFGEKLKVEKLNQWFCSFLKEYEIMDIPKEKNSYSIEVIMNTAIYNMVVHAANPAFIAKINGTKISSIEKKFYEDEKVKIEYKTSIDDLINYEISKSDYYNYI